LPVLPVLVLAAGLGGPRLAAMLSAVTFTNDRVEVRNFPHGTRQIPVAAIDRFDSVASEGVWSQVRFVRVQLLLNDGSKLIVRGAGDPEDGPGVTALNNRLSEMRQRMQASG
jgi:hypothetical protein